MLISKFGTATESAIHSCYPNMPDEMVKFLKKYNGGETPETHFDINGISTDIVGFYGIGSVKYSFSSVKEIYIDGEEYLPIAFDSFGNSIAISMSNGSIVFIDHEQSSAIKKIADSLPEFISKVKSDPISPKHTKSVQERERDLISRGRGQIITDELRALWQNEIEKYSNIHQETVVL